MSKTDQALITRLESCVEVFHVVPQGLDKPPEKPLYDDGQALSCIVSPKVHWRYEGGLIRKYLNLASLSSWDKEYQKTLVKDVQCDKIPTGEDMPVLKPDQTFQCKEDQSYQRYIEFQDDRMLNGSVRISS